MMKLLPVFGVLMLAGCKTATEDDSPASDSESESSHHAPAPEISPIALPDGYRELETKGGFRLEVPQGWKVDTDLGKVFVDIALFENEEATDLTVALTISKPLRSMSLDEVVKGVIKPLSKKDRAELVSLEDMTWGSHSAKRFLYRLKYDGQDQWYMNVCYLRWLKGEEQFILASGTYLEEDFQKNLPTLEKIIATVEYLKE